MGTCQGELCACPLPDCCNVLTSRRPRNLSSNFHLPKRTLERRATHRLGRCTRESEFTRWVYQGLCGLEKERKMRFDTVIMGGGLAGLLCGCNCKNTACAVPLSLVVKARSFLIWIAGFAEPSAGWSTGDNIHSGLESLRQQAPAHPYTLSGHNACSISLARRRH